MNTFAAMFLVVSAPSADTVFPFEKVRKCFCRRVFVVFIKNTVFPVLKSASVFQASLNEKLLFRLLLRLHQIEQRQLRLLLSRSVFDAFFFPLACGFRLILGFVLFGLFLEILLVLKAVVLFFVGLLFLFVVKRSRLIVYRDEFRIFKFFLFFRKQLLQFRNFILITLYDFRL